MRAKENDGRAPLQPPSRALMRLFSVYLSRYVPRHFHAVRIANRSQLSNASGVSIIYLNHASWWDPLTCMLLARRFFPGHSHFAPMDAEALGRYPMLARMGMFPVEQGTLRGAAQFLHAAAQIIERPKSILWITPQGAFQDVRQRPLLLKPGLAALLKRNPAATVMPLAIEYTFWNERLPEVLIHAGRTLQLKPSASAQSIDEELVSALTRAQDELARLAAARNPALFQTLLAGRAGVGVAYDAWRWMRSILSREQYEAEHSSSGASSPVRPVEKEASQE
jgi:1-acyl-sn-glycerol-3-phosphate acyltransferase